MGPKTKGALWGGGLGGALGALGAWLFGGKPAVIALAGGGGVVVGAGAGALVGKATVSSGQLTTGGGAPQNRVVQVNPDHPSPVQVSIAVGGTLTLVPPQSGTWALSPSTAWPPANMTLTPGSDPGIEVTMTPTAAGTTTIQWVQVDQNGSQLPGPVTATVVITAS